MTAEGLRNALRTAADWDLKHMPTLPGPLLEDHLQRSFEDRLASVITDFAGSMRFVYLHAVWFVAWIALNTGQLLPLGIPLQPFDPFPFGLLTLIVSLEAIFLSTFVMIAQNRQSEVADARAKADYNVNVRAEAEIARLAHLVEALLEHEAEIAAPSDREPR